MNRSAPPRSRVDEIRLARGFSNVELARLAGIDPSTMHKIASGGRGLSEHFADPLANALGVRRETLFARIGEPMAWLDEPGRGGMAATRSSEATAARSRDVPVFGTAEAGADGAFHLNNGEAIDWARRPAGLIDVPDVFAIYAEGDSMVPWRNPGELVFVHPTRPAAPGCHVIADIWEREKGEPPRAFLKKLVRRTATRVELEQYNPRKVLTFERERLGRLYRVIDWQEALGI